MVHAGFFRDTRDALHQKNIFFLEMRFLFRHHVMVRLCTHRCNRVQDHERLQHRV
jgi:hypothetical protein